MLARGWILVSVDCSSTMRVEPFVYFVISLPQSGKVGGLTAPGWQMISWCRILIWWMSRVLLIRTRVVMIAGLEQIHSKIHSMKFGYSSWSKWTLRETFVMTWEDIGRSNQSRFIVKKEERSKPLVNSGPGCGTSIRRLRLLEFPGLAAWKPLPGRDSGPRDSSTQDCRRQLYIPIPRPPHHNYSEPGFEHERGNKSWLAQVASAASSLSP